jgi:hypothetical protein
MSDDSNKKKITLTDEQAARAAEALLNGWLRNDGNNTNYSKKKPKEDNKQK